MPSNINGIPYALPADKLASWSATSKNLAQWIDHNVVDTADMTSLATRLAALEKTTGWRDITGALRNDWTADYVYIRRDGEEVSLRVLGLDGRVSTSVGWISFPAGFYFARSQLLLSMNNFPVSVQIGNGGDASASTQAYTPNTYAEQHSFWRVPGLSWPTNLPGTPA